MKFYMATIAIGYAGIIAAFGWFGVGAVVLHIASLVVFGPRR